MARRLRNGSFRKSSSDTAACFFSQSAAERLANPSNNLAFTSIQAFRTNSADGTPARVLSGLEMNTASNSGWSRRQTQQRQHRVMSGREMSPQIDQAVFSRCDLFQEIFFAESGKHFLGSLDVSLPSVHRNRQEQFLVRHVGFLLCFYWIRELGC